MSETTVLSKEYTNEMRIIHLIAENEQKFSDLDTKYSNNIELGENVRLQFLDECINIPNDMELGTVVRKMFRYYNDVGRSN